MHQVYAYGVIAPSRLIELDDPFPSEAGYAEIVRVHESLGGEAAGGAYALARLGVTTKLSGTRLGDDPESRRVIELLTAVGVDCSAVAVDATRPVTEFVFSSEGERTIFATYGGMLEAEAWSRPSREDVVSSRIVCLDPFFGDASEQVADWCREVSVPYVTVDAPPDSHVARHAEVVIVSSEFADRAVEAAEPHDVVATYTDRCRGLIVLTRGAEPVLVARRDEHVRTYPPFAVDARDTTGAGDSFRAGFIYGMLQGSDETHTLETASAVAAMVCQRVPGVLQSPTAGQLERFLGRAAES